MENPSKTQGYQCVQMDFDGIQQHLDNAWECLKSIMKFDFGFTSSCLLPWKNNSKQGKIMANKEHLVTNKEHLMEK